MIFFMSFSRKQIANSVHRVIAWDLKIVRLLIAMDIVVVVKISDHYKREDDNDWVENMQCNCLHSVDQSRLEKHSIVEWRSSDPPWPIGIKSTCSI